MKTRVVLRARMASEPTVIPTVVPRAAGLPVVSRRERTQGRVLFSSLGAHAPFTKIPPPLAAGQYYTSTYLIYSRTYVYPFATTTTMTV